MLTNYFTACHIERLRQGPAGSHLDGFTAWLAGHGYLPTSIQDKVRDAVRFAAWGVSEGFDDLDEEAHGHYLSLPENAHHTGSNLLDQVLHDSLGGGLGRVEDWALLLLPRIRSVEHDGVDMRVQIQR